VSTRAFSDFQFSCIGVSHHHAALDLLEKLSIPADALSLALGHFTPRDGDGRRHCEGVVLSTCNRTEIYFSPRGGSSAEGAAGIFAGLPDGLVDLLVLRSGLSREELACRLVRADGWAAAEHLFRVVCGLDSLVVGESQVVGQVARAYAHAQAARTAGVVLSTLFQSAIRGGRRARSRAEIGKGASNAGSAAVARAASAAGTLDGARVVVIGTGDIGRLVLQSLRGKPVERVDLVTRSEQRAAEVAARWGGSVHPISRLASLVLDCDVLISATAASQRIVTAEMVRGAMLRRPRRPLVLVDLGVPRTIDPVTSLIPGVQLLDIDSLKDEYQPASRPRDEAVERMIGEDLAELKVRMLELTLRPVIGGLWKKADAIRGDVLARAREQMPQLDDEAWARVEDLAASIVARLLHDPATRLRAEAGNGHAAAYAAALTDLFRLPAGPGDTR
jgi:glutamyl-tRNA reductase